MLRTYAVIIVLVAVAASWLVSSPSGGPSSRNQILIDASRGGSNGDPGNPSSQSRAIDELDHGVELTRDENGYFFADVQINGAPIHMLVDTGATVIALSRDDAQLAGIATPIGMNDVVGQGADGEVKGVQIRLDKVALGDKIVENVPAIVLNSGGQSLLGQSFLSQFASVKIEGDKMVLR